MSKTNSKDATVSTTTSQEVQKMFTVKYTGPVKLEFMYGNDMVYMRTGDEKTFTDETEKNNFVSALLKYTNQLIQN